jgi:hypothetical protein
VRVRKGKIMVGKTVYCSKVSGVYVTEYCFEAQCKWAVDMTNPGQQNCCLMSNTMYPACGIDRILTL